MIDQLRSANLPLQDNRKTLAGLLRFPSSACSAEQQLTSLSDYVARKKEGQTQIYYLAGACFPRQAQATKQPCGVRQAGVWHLKAAPASL